MRELDSAWMAHRATLGNQVPRPPSEYAAENVYIGASFLAPFEAGAAVRDGYAGNVLWGSDYPHTEGTYQHPEHDDQPSIGRMAMRHTFSEIAPADVRSMAGENAMRVYGLDPAKLRGVAARIGAPTTSDLAQPIDAIPDGAGMLAFRTFGAWA
jgi:predicted TIM-barrel fold metal-dependent hydrolase